MFIALASIGLFAISCQKETACNCQVNWQPIEGEVHVPGDQVMHNGICYRCVAQGNKTIEPGGEGDDIWEVCKD